MSTFDIFDNLILFPKNTMAILSILSMSANYAIGKIISQHASLYPQTPAGVQVYIQGEFETSSEV